MRAWRREGDAVEAEFDEFEVALVDSLVEQLTELLGGEPPAAEGLDAFAALAASLEPAAPLDHSDPLIERLFPSAYPDDEAAAVDFRRFTEEEARRARVAQARTVRDDLAASRGGAELVSIPPQHVDAWVKTINALRLSLSVRLRIVDEQSFEELARLPHRDPRSQLLDLYEWLGYVLESLLDAL